MVPAHADVILQIHFICFTIHHTSRDCLYRAHAHKERDIEMVMANSQRMESFLQEWLKSKRKAPGIAEETDRNGRPNRNSSKANPNLVPGQPPLPTATPSQGGSGASSDTARPNGKQVRFAGGSAMEVKPVTQPKS